MSAGAIILYTIAAYAVAAATVLYLRARNKSSQSRMGSQHVDQPAGLVDADAAYAERIALGALNFREAVHGFGSDELANHGSVQ